MVGRKPKGETTKSEAVNLRLSPRMRYALELLARKGHRNMTGVIESMISEKLDYRFHEELWDADKKQRALNLQKYEPHLLTYEEEVELKTINGEDHG